MTTPHDLLVRLDAIGRSLAQEEAALALLGLGSVGVELDRLDVFSDLDFFVIVRAGHKSRFLDNLDWLVRAHSIAYHFRNTVDGYKALFDDGIFAEFGVFEPEELNRIPFSEGRIVWKREEISDDIRKPAQMTAPTTTSAVEWLLGEALTNLYVGLGRHQRGEVLSAARLIQGHAVDRLLELAAMLEDAHPTQRDAFAPERRFEQCFPGMAQHLPQFVQGYGHNCESARAILDFLAAHFTVNAAISYRIRALCD